MSLHRRTRGLAVAATALFLSPAFGQTTAGGTTTTGGTSTSGGTKTPTIGTLSTTPTATTTTTPTTTTQPQTMPVPITVSGRVMLEDGTPAPVNTVLERVCSGTPHAVGFTDGQGYFSVKLGGESLAALQDASESSGRIFQGVSTLGTASTSSASNSSSRLSACDLRARLSGYRSQTIPLNDRKALDNPDVGVILIHKIGPSEAASTVTATSLLAPKPAHKAFQKGLDLLKKKKADEAETSFREAVTLFPQYAEAWVELGKLQTLDENKTEARRSFETAAQAEPRWTDPLLELCVLSMSEKNWIEVVDYTNRVLTLNSFSYPEAFYFNAVANYNLHHLEVAEKAARSAQKIDVRHGFPEAGFLLANILILHHQYPEATAELHNFLALAPQAPDSAMARKQLAELDHATASADAAK